ncbi:unnamed protein product [Ixodes hexagonus]
MPPSDDYDPCPPETNGELCVKSPTMMHAYYNVSQIIPSGNPPPFGVGDKYGEHTFLRTGDYGWCTEEGYLNFHGKVSDIMNLAGLTVLPHEFEDALRSLRFIDVICVFGASSKSVPGAVIAPKYDLEISEMDAERQLADFLRREGTACLTGGVAFVDKLPRLEDGRVLRRDILDRERSLQVTRPAQSED